MRYLGYAYTVDELKMTTGKPPTKAQRRAERAAFRKFMGPEGWKMLVAAHKAMCKRAGLPANTPMGHVRVTPA